MKPNAEKKKERTTFIEKVKTVMKKAVPKPLDLGPPGGPNQNGIGSMKLEKYSKLKNKTGNKPGKKKQ